jgi:hypothetical protein
MSAHPANNQTFDPITFPSATILAIGAALLDEEPHLQAERLPDVTPTMIEQIREELWERDKDHFRLGFQRGFMAGMCTSMIAWVIISMISPLFGEHEAVAKGVMMCFYIFVFARDVR